MSNPLPDLLRAAQVFDLEQPRFFGMPVYPSHKPGYFYALHRRHRDSHNPQQNGPRTGAAGMLTMMEHTGTHIDALCHQACGFTLNVTLGQNGSYPWHLNQRLAIVFHFGSILSHLVQ